MYSAGQRPIQKAGPETGWGTDAHTKYLKHGLKVQGQAEISQGDTEKMVSGGTR